MTASNPEPNPADAGSGEIIAEPVPRPPATPTDPGRYTKVRIGDRVFRGLSRGSGILVIALIASIGFFLLWRAIPSLARNEANFFLYGGNWITTDTSAMHFGVFELFQVTVFVSLFARATT